MTAKKVLQERRILGKYFILDTNVLIHDPEALFAFDDASIIIPAIVLEELDSFKEETNERGRNARQTIRYLDQLRGRGPLGEGVGLDNGGFLTVLFLPEIKDYQMPFELRESDKADSEILITSALLKEQGYEVIFISKDLNARVKADVLGIPAQDYNKEGATKDQFYQGWVRVPVPADQLRRELPDGVKALAQEKLLLPNEYVLAESKNNPQNYKVFRYVGGEIFVPVYAPKLNWPLQPRNPQQLMALDLLLNDDIKLVTLFGTAGTGKTFLALLAGLHKVLREDIYKKILISRPVVPLGRDIGYLPGTVEEKLHSWMLPIYDNMTFITHSSGSEQHLHDVKEELDGKRKKKGKHPHHRGGDTMTIEELTARGKLSLEAITYMRGRSIPYQYILIDEVQNLTAHEVKTLISRVGEGSKIVLTGDPYQIDSAYLDFITNGLVVLNERFKGQSIFGSIYLQTSERSELSQLVSELM